MIIVRQSSFSKISFANQLQNNGKDFQSLSAQLYLVYN